MNEVELYKKIIEEKLLKIFKERCNEYNAFGIPLQSYFPFGDFSYVHEIYKKTLRLLNLVNMPRKDYGKIVDSLVDLANYAIFYLMTLETVLKKPDEDRNMQKMQETNGNKS